MHVTKCDPSFEELTIELLYLVSSKELKIVGLFYDEFFLLVGKGVAMYVYNISWLVHYFTIELNELLLKREYFVTDNADYDCVKLCGKTTCKLQNFYVLVYNH